jgi:hypothetical protein
MFPAKCIKSTCANMDVTGCHHIPLFTTSCRLHVQLRKNLMKGPGYPCCACALVYMAYPKTAVLMPMREYSTLMLLEYWSAYPLYELFE